MDQPDSTPDIGIHVLHIAAGCNRVTNALDWGEDGHGHSLIAYAAHNSVLLYDVQVRNRLANAISLSSSIYTAGPRAMHNHWPHCPRQLRSVAATAPSHQAPCLAPNGQLRWHSTPVAHPHPTRPLNRNKRTPSLDPTHHPLGTLPQSRLHTQPPPHTATHCESHHTQCQPTGSRVQHQHGHCCCGGAASAGASGRGRQLSKQQRARVDRVSHCTCAWCCFKAGIR